MAYPSTISSFTNPNPSDRLNNPSHSGLHSSVNSAITQLETFVGTTSSAVGTLMYDIRSSNSDGGGHVQSANKGGTGQTAYTKGDVLVGQSTSVLTKLSVGADGLALIADSTAAAGVKWGVPNNEPTVRIYGGSVTGVGGSSFVGLWVKPSNLSYVRVVCVGGGGGGGGNTTNLRGGGGGGGGGYLERVIPSSSLMAVASVVLGMGGTGGAAGTGSVGGNTWFGSVAAAAGGLGGQSSGQMSVGGRGGSILSASILGDVVVIGGTGSAGIAENTTNLNIGGAGGSTPLGAGAATSAAYNSINGNPGVAYGGGGGGSSNTDNSNTEGGHGADGVIIVYEY